MKLREREKNFIVCPRCGLKSLRLQDECPDCGLVFARLEIATNKDAKRLIKKRQSEYIIKTSKLPKDVSYIKLLLLSIFTGLLGGHCFYVGKYWRGGILLLNFIALMMFVIFNAQLIAINGGGLLAALTTISGLIMMIWVYDVIMIIAKKFKVPVGIDLESDLSEIINNDKEQA